MIGYSMAIGSNVFGESNIADVVQIAGVESISNEVLNTNVTS